MRPKELFSVSDRLCSDVEVVVECLKDYKEQKDVVVLGGLIGIVGMSGI